MAFSLAKLVRTVCPRFFIANRSGCLTTPTVLNVKNKNLLQYPTKRLCYSVPRPKKETVVVYFLDRDGDTVEAAANVGDTLLDVALKNDIDLEGTHHSYVPSAKVKLTFTMPTGESVDVKAKVGDNLLDIIIENDVDIDGFGACEGTLACSTCHLIFKPEDFEQLPEKPTDEEMDMLDLAFDLQDTSRLGCQVVVTKVMDGWVVKVPAGVSDAREPS